MWFSSAQSEHDSELIEVDGKISIEFSGFEPDTNVIVWDITVSNALKASQNEQIKTRFLWPDKPLRTLFGSDTAGVIKNF